MSDAILTLEDRIDSAIRTNPHLAGRSLQVTAQDGQVVLQGTVHSYYEKQIAQEAARRVEGVDGVANRLVVRRRSAYPPR